MNIPQVVTMAPRRGSKRRRIKEQSAPEERISATPETRRKLRYDVIGRLERERRLRAEHVWAAKEIRVIWEAMGRSIFRGPSLTPQQPHMHASSSGPLDRLSHNEELIWRTKYRPWSREMAMTVLGGERISRLQLVLDIVVDNYGLREVETHYRMKHGAARGQLRDALQSYAEHAGWISV